MDIGTISSRYANALFSLAKEEKQDSLVYNDMKILQQNFLSEPTLKNVLNNPIISYNEKEKLLITSGGINVSDIYKRFIQMILKHKRENILQLITYIYIHRYRKEKKITRVSFDTAVPVNEKTKDLLKQKLAEETGCSIEFSGQIKPDLIGGFVLRIGNYRFDASFSSQLKQIKKRLIKSN